MTVAESAVEALDKLKRANAYGSRVEALRVATKACEPAMLREDPAFRAAIVSFGKDAEQASPEQRLEALLALADVGRVGKDIKKLAQAQVKQVLQSSPGSLHLVDGEKSQIRLCGVIAAQKREWVADYLAKAAMTPQLGEKARLAATVATFQRSSTWEEGFQRLASSAGPGQRLEQSQLTTVLAGARVGIAKSACPPGPGFAATLGTFMGESLRKGGPAETGAHSAKFASETVMLLDVSSAKRPSILSSPGIVDLLKRARGLAPKGRLSSVATAAWSSIATRIADVIRILALQGIPPVQWFGVLEQMTDSRDAALRYTKQMVSELEAPTPAMVTLLKEGYLGESPSSALRESDDGILATALLRAVELLPLLDSKAEAADHAKALAVEVQGLARRRGLTVEGSPSQMVAYSPLRHRLTTEVKYSPEKVRIVVPGIARNTGEIVLQAIVEAMKD